MNANGPPKKKRKKTKAEEIDLCTNPFHYIELFHSNKKPNIHVYVIIDYPLESIPPLIYHPFLHLYQTPKSFLHLTTEKINRHQNKNENS